jgi:hypothetical protein
MILITFRDVFICNNPHLKKSLALIFYIEQKAINQHYMLFGVVSLIGWAIFYQ